MHFSIDRTVHTTAFDKTSCGPLVGTENTHISGGSRKYNNYYLFIYLFIIIELNDLKALLFSIRATVKKTNKKTPPTTQKQKNNNKQTQQQQTNKQKNKKTPTTTTNFASDLFQRSWYMLSCMWDDAYKRNLVANR